jgi:hypothetical protein
MAALTSDPFGEDDPGHAMSRRTRRNFCAAATSADYALQSSRAGRYGYEASQPRVCDESFACYLYGSRRGDMSRLLRSRNGVTRSTATAPDLGKSGKMCLWAAYMPEPPIGIEPMTYALRVRRSDRLS